MENFFSNSLSDFADYWMMDQPVEDTAIDQNLPENVTVTFPACDVAGPEIAVSAEVFGDGDKATDEVAAEGELKEVEVVEEAVLKRQRRTGKKKLVEKSEATTSPSAVLRGRSRGRQMRAFRANVSPPLGTAKGRLTAYILNVNTGEDVVSQILSFSRFGPQAICTIFSATGTVSRVTISQPAHPYTLAKFEGQFEIITLSGSFTAGKIIGGLEDGGLLSILLGNPDGEVFGGLAGSLIAASPIQLVFGGLAKQTYGKSRRRRRAKSSVAARIPDNLKAEKVTTTVAGPADSKNFKTHLLSLA